MQRGMENRSATSKVSKQAIFGATEGVFSDTLGGTLVSERTRRAEPKARGGEKDVKSHDVDRDHHSRRGHRGARICSAGIAPILDRRPARLR